MHLQVLSSGSGGNSTLVRAAETAILIDAGLPLRELDLRFAAARFLPSGIDHVLVSRGILNSSLVHPREVFREAIAERAASLVLVHNHPSGDPTPSPDDRAITSQLVAAGRLLDIPIQDHVVIGRGRFVSFAEAGLL